MKVTCPYCGNEMVIVRPTAGRFAPRCALCDYRFRLLVPDDPAAEPTVAKLPPDAAKPRQGQGLALEESLPPPAPAIEPPAPPPATAQRQVPQARAAASTPARSAAPSTPDAARTQPPKTAPAKSDKSAKSPDEHHGSLGGYDLIRKLGAGGMGEVYLARQVSLDRNVAVKLLAPSLSGDPQFVSRFTREAYAAAQLSHHNVVQIYDIGLDQGVNFFSMEFVDGQNLATTTRQAGKLDPRTAVIYALQAARGLAFAHEHGMIHRDVKPDNLLLNPQGIVKVADLGLVKHTTATTDATSAAPAPQYATTTSGPASSLSQTATQAHISMGTPAYMPPEQSTDAAQVDQRADIYSLGCSLYDMLTGQPPFIGKTALEVITKHQRQAVVPPDVIVKDVPKTLSALLLRMIAKRPQDRYATMADVIAAFEQFLGVAGEGGFTPRVTQIEAIQTAVAQFNAVRLAKFRRWMISAFWLVCLAACFVNRDVAAGAVLFALLTFVIYQITLGWAGRSVVYRRTRQLVFNSSLREWLGYLAAATAVGLIIWATHIWFIAACVLLLSLTAATTFYLRVDLPLAHERRKPLAEADHLVRNLRFSGLDENALRHFVFAYTAANWEEFYEALFDYDAKITARQLWATGEVGRRRKRFARWRDPIIRWIDQRQAARRENRERRLLAKLEAKALMATGLDSVRSQRQADASAAQLIRGGNELRVASAQSVAVTAMPPQAAERAARNLVAATLSPNAAAAVLSVPSRPRPTQAPADFRASSLVSDKTGRPAEAGAAQTVPARLSVTDLVEGKLDTVIRKQESYLRRRYGTPFDWLVGRQVRFILAALILACFATWWFQTSRATVTQKFNQVTGAHTEISDLATQRKAQQAWQTVAGEAAAAEQRPPLHLAYLPNEIAAPLSSYSGALAGILLLLSVFFGGRMMGFLVIVAAAVALFGRAALENFVPGQPPPPWTAAATAACLWLLALVFFRAHES